MIFCNEVKTITSTSAVTKPSDSTLKVGDKLFLEDSKEKFVWNGTKWFPKNERGGEE